jgi:hypothetical protein
MKSVVVRRFRPRLYFPSHIMALIGQSLWTGPSPNPVHTIKPQIHNTHHFSPEDGDSMILRNIGVQVKTSVTDM